MQVVDKDGILQTVYKISELKELKVGDVVLVEMDNYDERECDIIETTVNDINKENIYFESGHDFPFYDTSDVTSDFAIQDPMDGWKFSVFKFK